VNEIETGRFLTMVIALDPKMPQPDDEGFMRKLWARQLAEVPFEAADKAMQAYYSSERYLERRDTISPADVVQWWNARRRPNERERTGTNTPRALPRPALDPQRIQAGVDRVLTALIGAKAEGIEDAEQQVAERRTARSVACPHCQAPAASPCIRSARGDSRVEMRNHHPSRVAAAEQQEAT
jgi:hypothetical protein